MAFLYYSTAKDNAIKEATDKGEEIDWDDKKTWNNALKEWIKKRNCVNHLDEQILETFTDRYMRALDPYQINRYKHHKGFLDENHDLDEDTLPDHMKNFKFDALTDCLGEEPVQLHEGEFIIRYKRIHGIPGIKTPDTAVTNYGTILWCRDDGSRVISRGENKIPYSTQVLIYELLDILAVYLEDWKDIDVLKKLIKA